jgi:hypothetical protein
MKEFAVLRIVKTIDSCTTDLHLNTCINYINNYFKLFMDEVGYDFLLNRLKEKTQLICQL